MVAFPGFGAEFEKQRAICKKAQFLLIQSVCRLAGSTKIICFFGAILHSERMTKWKEKKTLPSKSRKLRKDHLTKNRSIGTRAFCDRSSGERYIISILTSWKSRGRGRGRGDVHHHRQHTYTHKSGQGRTKNFATARKARLGYKHDRTRLEQEGSRPNPQHHRRIQKHR